MPWTTVARTQAGVITRDQLREYMSDTAIRGLVRRGVLERLDRCVFVGLAAPATFRQDLWRTALVTRGVLAGATAAHLWGMAPQPRNIHVILDQKRRLTAREHVTLRRTSLPSDAVVQLDGLLVTTRRWTALDYIGELRPAHAIRMADRCLQRSVITRDDIARRLDTYPGRRGNSTLRRILEASADGAAAESERVLHRLLRSNGIRDWVANYQLWHNGVLVAVIDVALVRHRIAIEIDGWAFHTDADQFQRDRTRQNLLSDRGWNVLRFTWTDLTQRPHTVIALVARAIARSI